MSMGKKKRTLRKQLSPPQLPESPQKRLKKRPAQLTPSQQKAKLLDFEAINLVRKGKAKTVSEAARTVGTTVKSIRKLLPAALGKRGPDGRIRVKAGDTYSARVEIITAQGKLVVTAHGSRERDLAGLHRSAIFKVLGEKAAPSSLRKFRGKKVGGHKLVTKPDQLRTLALAGELGQLDALYASPEVSS
jgi:hypothetical protein